MTIPLYENINKVSCYLITEDDNIIIVVEYKIKENYHLIKYDTVTGNIIDNIKLERYMGNIHAIYEYDNMIIFITDSKHGFYILRLWSNNMQYGIEHKISSSDLKTEIRKYIGSTTHGIFYRLEERQINLYINGPIFQHKEIIYNKNNDKITDLISISELELIFSTSLGYIAFIRNMSIIKTIKITCQHIDKIISINNTQLVVISKDMEKYIINLYNIETNNLIKLLDFNCKIEVKYIENKIIIQTNRDIKIFDIQTLEIDDSIETDFKNCIFKTFPKIICKFNNGEVKTYR